MIKEIQSVEAMGQLAAIIAGQLRGGDVLELVGDVGAGKTTFTKALAASLGVTDNVQSPTFTLSSVYELPDGGRLVHYDFYRLSEPGVMRDELRESVGDKTTVTVIEWSEVVADVLPTDRLVITFEHMADEAARRVRIEAASERSRQMIAGIDR